MDIPHAPKVMRADCSYADTFREGNSPPHSSMRRNGDSTSSVDACLADQGEASQPNTATHMNERKWHLRFDCAQVQIPIRTDGGYVMKMVPRCQAPKQHSEVMRLCYPEVYGKSSFEILVNTTDLKKNGIRIPEREQLNAVYNDRAWPSPVALVYNPDRDFSPRTPGIYSAVTGDLSTQAPVCTPAITSMNSSGDSGPIDNAAPKKTSMENLETPTPAMAGNGSSTTLLRPLLGNSSSRCTRFSNDPNPSDGSSSSEVDVESSITSDSDTVGVVSFVCEGGTHQEPCYLCGATTVNDRIDTVYAATVEVERYLHMAAAGRSLRAFRMPSRQGAEIDKEIPVTISSFALSSSYSGSSSGEEVKDEEYTDAGPTGLGINFESMVEDLVASPGEFDNFHLLSEKV